MADSKPYASLSSGLLARKGGAKPAMRPQGFNSFGGSLEDLGWNDMGPTDEYEHHTATQLGLTPAPRSHLHVAPPPAETPSEEAPLEARFDEEPLEEEAFEAEAFEAPAEEAPAEEELAEEAPFEEAELDEESFEAESFEEAAFEAPEQAAPPPARASVAPPPVVEQQRALRKSFATERQARADVVALPRRRAAPSNLKSKAAFTLRLDPERHLKLRLASAVTRMSAQQLVTGALDEFLNSLPELDALADRVPAEAGQRRS